MKWMDRERSFWVIGGDLRQRALARLLREDGHTVHIAGLEGEGLEQTSWPRCWTACGPASWSAAV